MLERLIRPRFLITTLAVIGMTTMGVIEPEVRVPVVSALGGAIAGYFGVEDPKEQQL